MAVAKQAKQSKQGNRPSGRNFECAGCMAAVRSAHALLGKRVADEGAVQELLESAQRVCSASNFEEEEQSRWSLPPPETSRACSAFVQVQLAFVHTPAFDPCTRLAAPGCQVTCRRFSALYLRAPAIR